MANYIDKEILCEAYTHLDIGLYEDKTALENLRKQLEPFFQERARFLLGEDVEIQIEFEEGSLRTKLQVLGSAGKLLLASAGLTTSAGATTAAGYAINAVIKYGDFRVGIEQFASDAAALAQSANLEVIFRTKTAYCDRVTIEKRKGIFGRVDELLSNLSTLHNRANNKDFSYPSNVLRESTYIVEQLIIWDMRLGKLFDKTDSSLTEECIAGGLLEELKRMPKKLAWQNELDNESFKTKILKSDPALYGQLEGVSAQYKATVKSIQQKLEDRYKAAHKNNSK